MRSDLARMQTVRGAESPAYPYKYPIQYPIRFVASTQ